MSAGLCVHPSLCTCSMDLIASYVGVDFIPYYGVMLSFSNLVLKGLKTTFKLNNHDMCSINIRVRTLF